MSNYKDYRNQDVVFTFERENDNYFALVWGDPNTMQIRNTEQMMRFFENIKEDEGKYVEFWDMQNFKSSSPTELFKYLVENHDASVIDEGGFVSIRCLARAY